MFQNFIRLAWRTLRKNRLYAIINISGLTLGLSSVMLIILFVRHELSYDQFHQRANDIYRIYWQTESPQTRTPHPMAQAMVQEFPEVEQAVSLSPLWGAGLTRRTFSIRNPENDIRFDERNVLSVDSTFFKVFTFPLIYGDPKTALSSVDGVLISESTAKKYFGDINPVGKHLMANDEEAMIEVKGVFKDVPENAHFHFDFLISYVREKAFEDEDSEYYTWNDFGHYNYILLKPRTDVRALESKLIDWVTSKYIPVSREEVEAFKASGFGFRLQPITDIHLHSNLRWELEPNGNIEYVYIMSGAALFLLIIACVNMMNLTTATATERAKEIGVRKTLGALRSQLAVQFIAESFISVLIAGVLAILLIDLLLPFFNSVTRGSLTLSSMLDTRMVMSFVLIFLLIGIISGLYPAFYMSAINPGLILKGKFSATPKGTMLRKGLIVFQFFSAMMLISGTAIIFNQMEFLSNKNLGFDKEELLVFPMKDYRMVRQFEALQTELLRVPGVVAVTGASNIPGQSFNNNSIFQTADPENRTDASEVYVDYDFFQTLGIQLVEGRLFSRESPADTGNVFIINETLARNLSPAKTPVGMEITWLRDGDSLRGPVVGIINDFHFQSLHQPIGPLLVKLNPYFNHVLVKIKPENFKEQIAQIEKTWRKFDDTFGFEFTFLNQQLDEQYRVEQKMASVVGGFSALAVAIACFGLFGLAALSFQQRIKEVGIRKTLGAPLSGLIVLLMRDFTKLVAIAIILAIPVAWWLMEHWLQNFTFRITLNPLWFLLSGIILLLIAWATIVYLTIKTTFINPVETLRHE